MADKMLLTYFLMNSDLDEPFEEKAASLAYILRCSFLAGRGVPMWAKEFKLDLLPARKHALVQFSPGCFGQASDDQKQNHPKKK